MGNVNECTHNCFFLTGYLFYSMKSRVIAFLYITPHWLINFLSDELIYYIGIHQIILAKGVLYLSG